MNTLKKMNRLNLPSVFNDPFFTTVHTTLHPELAEWFGSPKQNQAQANLYENKDGQLVAELAMPGFDKNNIHITLKDGELMVQGRQENTTSTEDKEHQYFYRGFSVNEATQRFSLPYPVDEDAVSANYTDGILKVLMTKASAPEGKRITIR